MGAFLCGPTAPVIAAAGERPASTQIRPFHRHSRRAEPRSRGAFETKAGSEALPGIDLEQLASFLDRPTASEAIRDYRAALRPERQTEG